MFFPNLSRFLFPSSSSRIEVSTTELKTANTCRFSVKSFSDTTGVSLCPPVLRRSVSLSLFIHKKQTSNDKNIKHKSLGLYRVWGLMSSEPSNVMSFILCGIVIIILKYLRLVFVSNILLLMCWMLNTGAPTPELLPVGYLVGDVNGISVSLHGL